MRADRLRGLTLALATLIACGPAAAPVAPATAAPAAPAATAAPTVAAATPAPATPTPTRAPSLLDLAKAKATATYRVTYRLSSVSGGQTVSGEQTWYVKPPKSRFDLTFSGGTSSTFVLEDGTYNCTSQAGRTVCLKTAKQQALAQNQGAQADDQVASQPDAFDTTYQGTRQIAGQTAQCFTLRPKSAQAGFGEGTFCYSADGVTLLISTKTQTGEFSLEATAFSTSVSDDVFKLPAPAISLP